jgi:presenilin-like A22 family membrane protease
MDIESSWGKHELNATLSNGSGRFGVQGALIKLGLQGGLIGIEFLIMRHHPNGKLYRALGLINFGAAAGITAVAVHNYGVPEAR